MEKNYIEFLKRYISENSGISIESIDGDADIFAESYIDSIGIFTLFVEIEVEFGVEISLDSLEDINTLTLNTLAKIIEDEK